MDDGNQEREGEGVGREGAQFCQLFVCLCPPPSPLTLSLMLLLDGPMDRLLGCYVVEKVEVLWTKMISCAIRLVID